MKNSVLCGTVLLLAILSTCYGDPASCGDWEPFSDQHCYKVIDKDVTHSHSDAEKLCQQNGASLISIRAKEEQDFLTSFLFTRLKVVDDVWLDAQFVPGEKKYKWTKDGAELTYSNWAEGNRDNLADYCVELHAKSAGKWDDEPCSKKNLVVCQKDQIWTVEIMQKMLKEMQQKFQRANQEANATIEEMQQNVLKTQTELQETRKEITKLQGISQGSGTPIPVGFLYVQLPGEKSPSEMWSGLVWSDVSSTYAGVFFRVEGGNATEFGGGVQEDNAPHLTRVDYEHNDDEILNSEQVKQRNSDYISESRSLKPGQRSYYVRSGFHSVGQSQYNPVSEKASELPALAPHHKSNLASQPPIQASTD